MASFRLTIVTPDSTIYEGDAEKLVVRTTEGEVCILPRHIDYLAAVGIGEARITVNGSVRKAQCSGGMLHVSGSHTSLITTSFSWKDK